MTSLRLTAALLVTLGAAGAASAGSGQPAPAALAEAAEAELRATLALPDVARVDVRSAWAADERLLRRRLVRLEIPARQRADGQVLARVTVEDGARTRDGWVKLTVAIARPLVVAGRDLARGERLSPGDLRVEMRPWSGGEVLDQLDEAAGRLAKRRFRAGEPLAPRWLEAPKAAERGEQIRGVVRRGAVSVETVLEALESGKVGETIRARVTMTGKLVQARLVAAGRAEVSSP